ncbi:MAG: redox-regulated ATPase YchF [Actinomycetota bacterium]|nr:redox-regulated ATPase YchF [Actinomycetota bacterium]
MKIGITGFSNSGKTTVFNALTGQNIETTAYATTSGEPHVAVVGVPDERLDKLSAFYKPKKTTRATVDYVDYLGLTKGDPKQNAKVFELIRDSDALLHVARAFEDPSVPHPLESVDPLRDAQYLEAELILGDLALVEKRLGKINELAGKGKKDKGADAEKEVLERCMEALESETPLRAAGLGEDDLKAVRHLGFLSLKPELVVFNVSEEALKNGLAAELAKKASEKLKGSVEALALSGKIEMELAQMPPEDAGAFLEDLGVKEPALNRLIRASYRLLDYISFFTAGEDECRAWSITNGTPAKKAAGKIHSDIEKGFIRAEIISYEDFMKVNGSMGEARSHGYLRLEGKDYPMKDGDIVNFRFNV